MRRKDFSSHWTIPNEAFDEVVALLERRYEDVWGELDVDRPAVKTVTLYVAHVP
jgi:hypothetical protein